MGESLMQRRCVGDEGLRVVKPCQEGRTSALCALTVPPKKAPANYVPAAAVKRKGRALSGITGRIEHVGGWVSDR